MFVSMYAMLCTKRWDGQGAGGRSAKLFVTLIAVLFAHRGMSRRHRGSEHSGGQGHQG